MIVQHHATKQKVKHALRDNRCVATAKRGTVWVALNFFCFFSFFSKGVLRTREEKKKVYDLMKVIVTKYD